MEFPTALLFIHIVKLLDINTLLSMERVCSEFKSELDKLDSIIWKELIIKSFRLKITELPLSYETWKLYYACLLQQRRPNYDYYSLQPNTTFRLHKASFEEIKNRMTNRIGLNQSIKEKKDLNSIYSRRYICCLATEKCYRDNVLLIDNHLWYSEGCIIYGLNLNYTSLKRRALHGHTNRVKILISSANNLVSLDESGMILVWDILDNVNKPIKSINYSTKTPKCINIEEYMLMVLFDNGEIYILDLKSDELLSSFSLNPHYTSLINVYIPRIIIRNGFLVIGMSNGLTMVFEKISRNGDKSMKFDYQLTKTLFESDIIEHNQTNAPFTLELQGDLLITNGSFPDEVSLWKIEANEDENQCVDYQIVKYHTLSEVISLEKFGMTIPLLGDIHSCKFDIDNGALIAYSYPRPAEGGCRRLLIWDFRVARRFDRIFEYVMVGNIGIWLCYDQIPIENAESCK